MEEIDSMDIERELGGDVESHPGVQRLSFGPAPLSCKIGCGIGLALHLIVTGILVLVLYSLGQKADIWLILLVGMLLLAQIMTFTASLIMSLPPILMGLQAIFDQSAIHVLVFL